MTLTLLAVSLNDQPLSQPITAHFDGRGGTIGRADHNTMALPDPERHISRLQAEVVASGERFIIRNVGAANPITVAGRSLGHNDTAALGHGDEIRIGGYLLQVDSRTQEAALDVTRGRAMLAAPNGLLGSPGNAPMGSLSGLNALPRNTTPTLGFGLGLGLGLGPGQGAASTGGTHPGNPFADLLGPAPAAAPSFGPTPLAAAPTAPAASSDPFADLFGAGPLSAPVPMPAPVPAPLPMVRPAPADDPFASLLPPPAGVPADSAAVARANATPAAKLPDNFDPFANPHPGGGAAAAASARAHDSSDPFAAFVPLAPAPSIDAMFGLGNAASGGGDALANFMAGAPPAAPGGASAAAARPGGLSADPIEALFGRAPPPPAAPVQSDHVPALNAAYAPPRMRAVAQANVAAAAAGAAPIAAAPVVMPAPTPAPVAAPMLVPRPVPLSVPTSAPAASADATRLWAALCQGAGINLPMPAAGAEAQLRDIGRILRSAVDGTLRLMAVRTSTRHEMRAQVTIIQARNNNPLKFSPDAQAALEALLQPSVRGFLEGPAAMEDAMQDLVGHSIGSVAGMRAALEGVLDRFAPEQLEGKLTSKSVLDSLLTGPRKARLWDLYLQHQSTIRDEATDDFHALFGKAFLAAYEQQVAQLKRNAKVAAAAAAAGSASAPGASP